MVMVKRKTNMGRRKIEIKKVQNEEARQVCFSKRRTGLFKKASELAILCGAEISIVVFSPAGKVFSFGHPSVDGVMDHFFAGDPSLGMDWLGLQAHHGSDRCEPMQCELNRHHTELVNLLEVEKKKRDALKEALKASQPYWWDARIEDLELEEVQRFGKALEELKKNVEKRLDKLASARRPDSVRNVVSVANPFFAKEEAIFHHQDFGYDISLF